MAANRVGKALPVDEPVLTPIGWRRMGDLAPGDLVIGGDGHGVPVVDVFPQGVRRIVELQASDGAHVRCDMDHLWSVRPVRDGRSAPFEIMTAAALRDALARGERWMLPDRPCVQFEASPDLPVDPYLLGVLLGDGGLSTGAVYVTGLDDEVLAYCRNIAPEYGCKFVFRGGQTWQFVGQTFSGGRRYNVLAALVESLGLRGKTAHHKRIPPGYLVASPQERLALLRGLMDTDGSCGANGSRQFYSVSRGLCDDVCALVRSLGITAAVRPKRGRYNGEEHNSWLVQISRSPESIFTIARKRAREQWTDRKSRGVMIEQIVDAGEAECVCIKIANEDGLFVASNYVVTHNTVVGGYETVLHLTGDYPHWWDGRRFDEPVDWWAAGDTSETTRDVVQMELLGPPGDFGTGMIPWRSLVGEPTARRGVADAVDTIRVKHKTGGVSTLGFKSYDQGRKKFQGTKKHGIWLDEEPPEDVYDECLMRTMTTSGLMICTFTPLQGLSKVALRFLPHMAPPPDPVAQKW